MSLPTATTRSPTILLCRAAIFYMDNRLLLVLEGGVLLHPVGFELALDGAVAVALSGDE